MNRQNIEKQTKYIIIKSLALDIKEEEIKANTSILRDLPFDSMMFIKFIVNLEEEFNLKIDDDDLDIDKFDTFASFIDLLIDKYHIL